MIYTPKGIYPQQGKRPPKTLRGWSAKYRRDMKAVKRELGLVRAKLAAFEHQESFRKLQEEINWSDYDRAVDATTAAETDLFKASPAYQKYQQFRRARIARDARPQSVGKAGFTPLSGRTPP